MSTIGLLLLIAEAFQMAAAAPQADASAQPPRRVAAPLPDSVRIVATSRGRTHWPRPSTW